MWWISINVLLGDISLYLFFGVDWIDKEFVIISLPKLMNGYFNLNQQIPKVKCTCDITKVLNLLRTLMPLSNVIYTS